MGVVLTLLVIFLLAFLVESFVEYFFGQAVDHFPKLQPWKWALMYVAAAVGVIAAFVYQFDLVHLLGEYLGVPIQSTIFGIILTGLAIGRGSNFIHDLIDTFFKKPEAES